MVHQLFFCSVVHKVYFFWHTIQSFFEFLCNLFIFFLHFSCNYIHSVCRLLLEFTSRFSFVQNICHRRDSTYNLCFSTYLSRQNNTALFSQWILIHLQDCTHIAYQVVFQGRRSCPTEPLQNHLFFIFQRYHWIKLLSHNQNNMTATRFEPITTQFLNRRSVNGWVVLVN